MANLRMKLLWEVWAIGAVLLCAPIPASVGQQRKLISIDGDVILGALFPVHRQPTQKTAYTRQCGEIWEQYGMHRIEAFLLTLDAINNDTTLLPNVTLGCDIRDSCWYPPVALEQSIDFIKNSISASIEPHDVENMTQEEHCVHEESPKPIAGLIGPGSSTVTVQVQNLLQLFNIPQIGYAATSKDLSDKSLYKYFLRVVPPDNLQAKAMLDVVLKFNWTYISTVYTEGNYGASGMEAFTAIAKKAGLCIATAEKVKNNADYESYNTVIRNLKETPNARVVVCFCEGMTVKGLLNATTRLNAVGEFLFIGSDGWAVRPDVVKDLEEAAAGGMSIRLHSPPLRAFDQHYFNLSPFEPSRNPWFQDFWQEKFQCYINGENRDKRFSAPCTGSGEEDLSINYVQDAKLGFVVNAIYTMAHALHNIHQLVCNGRPGVCPGFLPVNGSIFLSHLINVSFTNYANESLYFDQNGDPPGRYEIMNYQYFQTPNSTEFNASYVQIGEWLDGILVLNESIIQWPQNDNTSSHVESACSRPCPKGKVKQFLDASERCCWACIPCKENQILLSESQCENCAKGWWPNDDLTVCLPIKIEFMQWQNTEAVVACVFASVGTGLALFTLVIFFKYNNTPVVKASTRELSYIILIGIVLAYFTTFALLAKPSETSCYITRILPGLAFSMIYGALVTRTNRIARILARSKKKIMTKKPRFMGTTAQIFISIIIIILECGSIIATLIYQPANSTLDYPTPTRVKLVCNTTVLGIMVPMGFDFFLIAACTFYAIKTRNVPENFNEAKFIGFTMYTTCVIWVAFVPIYFGSESKVITMCMCVSLSATVALVILFFPKLYIILLKPHRNSRSAFTTTKDVRCHIGSSQHTKNSFDEKVSTNFLRRYRFSLDSHDTGSPGTGNSLDELNRRSVIAQLAYTIARKPGAQSSDQEGKRGVPEAPDPSRSFRLWRQDSIHVLDKDFFAKDNKEKSDEQVTAENTYLNSRSKPAETKGKSESWKRRLVEKEVDEFLTSCESEASNGSLVPVRQETSCQTSDDLIESWLPALRLRFRSSQRSQGESPVTKQWDSFRKISAKHRTQNESENTEEGESETAPLLNNSVVGDSKSEYLLKDKEGKNSKAYTPFIQRQDGFDIKHNYPINEHELSNFSSSENYPLLGLNDNSRTKPTDDSSGSKVNPPKKGEREPSTVPRPDQLHSLTHNPSYLPKTPNKTVTESENCPLLRSPAEAVPQRSVAEKAPEKTTNGGTPRNQPVTPLTPLSPLSTTSEHSTRGSSPRSLEEMSVHGLKLLDEEEDSVEKFREYLLTKGMDMDMSEVQSSDV
ncbi:metabotropic glutamate receptor 1 [Lingula anatina]|uniref:Metabotropic glutamate receptor 1 n=1 Tax=Lingula anatina TaxID=7574 RepID=A0A1S3HL97_LINAN|nr:metabotropic glutamate receptor 1 [Lingula anatina]|eukprot:XP_013385784.1 metabotropic glutamate receptor 1 [Lingula anatina]